ncbi:hypothetical protein BSKO_07012 [Bryopsis sp. KO-2023]|nr:hypothetical protein BSKO_07012 [Bryopsis sp. KO-2023]
MVDATRALLDELMGKHRNMPLTEKSDRGIKYSDPTVCKHQLAGLCPNKLFKNTKSDLGLCQYEIHDDHIEWESIKSGWDALDEREQLRYGYERDLLRLLEQHIRDMDKKIAKAKERAEKESAPRELKPDEKARLTEIQTKVKEALEKSQQLGEEGDVDGSMMFAQQVESLKQQHDSLKKTFTQPERTMTVCEVCGVFINSTDNEQRRKASSDHLNGKQYIGWKKIREAHNALVEKFDRIRKEREPAREQREEREKDRERERPSRRERERSRSRGSRRERESERSARDRERYHRRHRSRSPRHRSPGHQRMPPPDDLYRNRRSRHEEYAHRY